jgi:hypothetical protein
VNRFRSASSSSRCSASQTFRQAAPPEPGGTHSAQTESSGRQYEDFRAFFPEAPKPSGKDLLHKYRLNGELEAEKPAEPDDGVPF